MNFWWHFPTCLYTTTKVSKRLSQTYVNTLANVSIILIQTTN
jgi:hypothetical protein